MTHIGNQPRSLAIGATLLASELHGRACLLTPIKAHVCFSSQIHTRELHAIIKSV
jgi:hypothetical protein